jgi:eukaryotic-like serine/threonine-protein kinase
MQGRVLGGRYRLMWQLGQGGMGSVWRAEQLNLPIKLAIKLIDPNQVESAEIRERFRREAHAAAKLRSKHIVHISDYGIDQDTPYIVMELLEGENLAKRLARLGRLTPEQTLHVLSQVARALAFAHENGIIHRDLKPENVFIESGAPGSADEPEDEVVKVLDFGVAKVLDSQSFSNELRTRTGIFLGTPFYMSPEQIRDSSEVDHRADVWSFGVMAYECATGRRPFVAKTLVDLQFAICRDPLVLPSQVAQVPSGFDAWFERAVSRDIGLRFESIKAAMAALRAALGSVADSARATAPTSNGVGSLDPTVTDVADPPSSRSIQPLRRTEPVAVQEARSDVISPNSVEPASVTSPIHSSTTSLRASTVLAWAAVSAAVISGFWVGMRGVTRPDRSTESTLTSALPAASSSAAANASPGALAASSSTIIDASRRVPDASLLPETDVEPVVGSISPMPPVTVRPVLSEPSRVVRAASSATVGEKPKPVAPKVRKAAANQSRPTSQPNKYGFD